MTKLLANAFVFIFFSALSFGADVPDENQTRTDFEKLAAQMPYLSVSWIVYDRPDDPFHFADRHKTEEYLEVLTKARDRKYTKEALLSLLTHRDPKVRTLAAVTLFDREDPSVLPGLVSLCVDEAPTFDGHPELNKESFRFSGIGPPTQKQTVGYLARIMVAFYMERSGYYYGIEDKTKPPQRGFAEYWEERKNRSHCAGWFAVQLARAGQSRGPTPNDRIERIRALRKRIDELPGEDRTWVLMSLNGESGSDALATETELVETCKKTGPDKLLLMLQNKIPSDDPDLQPPFNDNSHGYGRMAHFVLRHADQVLRPGDSEALLACEVLHRDINKRRANGPIITPRWAIAAARVNPEDAPRILHDALDRFNRDNDTPQRSELYVAMWQIIGKPESNFIVKWFYEDIREHDLYQNDRIPFVDSVGKDASGREIIARIIQDPRFPDGNWRLLDRLVWVVNRWSKTPIVTQEEWRKAWHPLGQGALDRFKVDAERKYPKETEELRANLREWHKRLRASVPDWLGQPAR